MKPLTILLFIAASIQAAELAPNRIPASANWVLHVDLDAMRASSTGKAVIGQIETDHGPGLRAIKRMFSVHLINDLRGVTLYGDGRRDHAVVWFDGRFDQEHLVDVLRAAEDYKTSSHGGVTIHSWKDKGHVQHAAFAANDLLAFSRQEDLLREALDVMKTPASGSANPIIPEPSPRTLIVAGANLAEIEMPDDSAKVLRQMGLVRLHAAEDGGRFMIRMDAGVADASAANRLRRVLDGMAALAEIGNADLVAGGMQADIGVTDWPGVRAQLSMPVDPWLRLLEKEAARRKAATKP